MLLRCVTSGRPLALSEVCLSRELDLVVCKPFSPGTSTLLRKGWRLRVTGLAQEDLKLVIGNNMPPGTSNHSCEIVTECISYTGAGEILVNKTHPSARGVPYLLVGGDVMNERVASCVGR